MRPRFRPLFRQSIRPSVRGDHLLVWRSGPIVTESGVRVTGREIDRKWMDGSHTRYVVRE
ncbi:hypothetical protein GCM10014719_63940 [Planomonospora parontospora subsp. antibiotica]|nr:hypothetical protein GCM10014719_63940 [Planomonospora parontospora subsp. antibiotica]GII19638.1 hypothetical protein Ppa05_63640 [Planomonospora parontospora subsp. antibiotica]